MTLKELHRKTVTLNKWGSVSSLGIGTIYLVKNSYLLRMNREKIMKLGHEGHPGIVWMKQRLRSKLWWPGFDKDIEKHCKSCYGCQLVAKPMNQEPLHRTVLPSQPWQDLAIDFLGPLP